MFCEVYRTTNQRHFLSEILLNCQALCAHPETVKSKKARRLKSLELKCDIAKI